MVSKARARTRKKLKKGATHVVIESLFRAHVVSVLLYQLNRHCWRSQNLGHRAPWRHCERRNLALATREALQHRALRAVAARGALAFHTARWLPRTREGIVVNIRLVSLLTLLRLVSLSTWLITRSARVLQLWFRCGSGVVQVWFRCGSGVVQVWLQCDSGALQV